MMPRSPNSCAHDSITWTRTAASNVLRYSWIMRSRRSRCARSNISKEPGPTVSQSKPVPGPGVNPHLGMVLLCPRIWAYYWVTLPPASGHSMSAPASGHSTSAPGSRLKMVKSAPLGFKVYDSALDATADFVPLAPAAPGSPSRSRQKKTHFIIDRIWAPGVARTAVRQASMGDVARLSPSSGGPAMVYPWRPVQR